MAAIVTRTRGARQPPVGTYAFNADSPQANGLFYWLGGVGVKSHNHSWPVPWTESDVHSVYGPYRSPNPWTTFGLRSVSNDSGVSLGTVASALIKKHLVRDFTVVLRHRMESYPNVNGSIIASDAWTLGSDDSNYEIGGVATTNKMYFRYRTGSGTSDSVTCSSLTFAEGADEKKVRTYVVTRSGATVRFYKDSATNYEELTLGTNVDVAWKGAPNGTSISHKQQAHVADFRMYNRALSQEEVRTVMDPQVGWDLFAAPAKRAYFHIPSTPSTARAGRKAAWTGARAAPRGPWTFNAASAQAQGLVWWFGGTAPAPRDMYQNPLRKDEYYGLYDPTPWGLLPQPPGGDRYGLPIDNTAPHGQKVVRNMTALLRVLPVSVNIQPTVGSLLKEKSNSTNWDFRRDSTSAWAFAYRTGAGTSASVVSTLYCSTTNRRGEVWGVRRDGASVRFFKHDGSVLSTDDQTLGTDIDVVYDATGTHSTVIGSQGGGYYVAEARLYNRALSDAEIIQACDPAMGWDLFAVPPSRVYFDIPATNTNRVGRITRMVTPGVRPSW